MTSCCAPSSLVRQLVSMLSLMKLPKAETLASRTAGSQPRARPVLMHSRAPWRARHRAQPPSSPAARAVNSRQETRQLPPCEKLLSRVPRPQSSSLDPKTRTGTGDNLMASRGRQHGRARILGRDSCQVAQKSPAERTFAQFAERLSFLTILDNFFTTNYRYHRDQKTKAFQCRTITAPGRKHSSREPP